MQRWAAWDAASQWAAPRERLSDYCKLDGAGQRGTSPRATDDRRAKRGEMGAGVPIPFRDEDERDEWGTAAHLRLEPDPDRAGYRGALFQINARGEPVEFTYNRVETPNSFLWRPADVRRAALRRLTASLLAACPQTPRVLFALAAEVPSELFAQDLQAAVPVCRVATGLETTEYSTLEVAEMLDQDDPVHLFWFPAPPAVGSPEGALTRHLTAHGLLLEPFERAAIGLAEVYGAADLVRP
jgi:hypothetical protein